MVTEVLSPTVYPNAILILVPDINGIEQIAEIVISPYEYSIVNDVAVVLPN